MADLSECLESSFDPVQWINDAINSREDQEEPLERYVAELEMKLQLAAEELETSLTDQSELALRRIPAAIHDINRLQREAESMGGQLHSLHGALPSEQRKASYTVRGLRQVMEVKARMEGACATLQEATELAELLTDIDAVFSRGDVVGMAEMVARMRRSLHLVKEVKELSGSLDRLQILEQRLEASLEPSLSEAMLTRQGEKVRDTWRVFGSIQQQAKAEAIYVAIGISRLQELWNAAATAGSGGGSGGGAMAWMPDLQDRLAREMETDYAFCAAALPEQAPSLTVRVVEGFWQRVHEACGQMLREVVAKGGEDGAARIIGLRDNAVRYCDHLLGVLQGATDAQKQSVASAFQQPFEVVVDAYGELERALLLRLVADVPVQAGGSGGEDELDATVAQLFASQDTTAALVRAAAARCLALTGDTSLPALLQVADEALALFVSRILALIQSLRENTAARLRRRAPAAAPPPMEASGSAADPLHEELGSPAAAAAARASGGAPAEALEQVEMNALLRLLLFCSRLVAQLSQLEVQCRGRIAALAPVLAKAAAGPADPADLVQLRLAASVPLVKQLAGLEESMKSTRFMALPKALGRASALQGQVTGLVQDTLMAPVQLHLAALRQQAVWEQAESENSFNLPTFSTYPSASITGVGEYLMVLPQQLEYLVPPDTDAMSQDDGGLASEWLDRVTAAAAAEFSQQVLDTPALSAVGAGQLAADAEYLVNVVGALGVAVPPALLTVKEVAGLEPGMFRDHVQAGLQDGALDRKMVLALAAKRDIDISAALASA